MVGVWFGWKSTPRECELDSRLDYREKQGSEDYYSHHHLDHLKGEIYDHFDGKKH